MRAWCAILEERTGVPHVPAERRVERDPGSGRWYALGADGRRLHGPYLSEREARGW